MNQIEGNENPNGDDVQPTEDAGPNRHGVDSRDFETLLEEKRKANGEAKKWRKTLEAITDMTGLSRDELIEIAQKGDTEGLKARFQGLGSELRSENTRLRRRIDLMEMKASTEYLDTLEGIWQLPENVELTGEEFRDKYAPLFVAERAIEIKGGKPSSKSLSSLRDEARRRGDVRRMLSLNRGKENR